MNKKLCLVLACLVVFVGAMIVVELVRADSDPFAPAMHPKCRAPKNIDNCAGFCEEKQQCKQCCYRGGFRKDQRNECLQGCSNVWSGGKSSTTEPIVVGSDDMEPSEP